MLKLHILENTELSAYCLSILEKHGIHYVRDFISENPEKLMKILHLNFEQIRSIKKEFSRLYGPKRHQRRIKLVYGSYINDLDNMLAPHLLLNNLSFWEICGPTGVGKTQLAFTLLLNFVTQQYHQALYIDTKLDFSANRIRNMLKSREIEAEQHAGIMSFIKVERVLSAQGLVEMLEELHKQLMAENEDVKDIKLVVIDSLPAVWFLLRAESNRLASKWLLSRLSQILNRLVWDFYIAVICVNLSLLPSPEENEGKLKDNLQTNINENDISDLIEADDMITDVANDKSSPLASTYRPALGYFWLGKPHLRLSLEFPDENDVSYKEDSSLRILKLLKSTKLPSNLSCMVRLQPEGVI